MARLAHCRRSPLRRAIERAWEDRGWLLGTWVLHLDPNDESTALAITTSAKTIGMGREVMRFKVIHCGGHFRYVYYTE